MRLPLIGSGLLVALCVSPALSAAEYHVSQKTGSDSGPGTSALPWQTIQKAASTLQPGDTCTVHAGTYRERVDPARGGSSEETRITYRAADGESVYLKGSEQQDTWTADGSLWKAVVPNSIFGAFNPYSAKITGSYLTYGGNYHLGEVYFEGEPFSEVLTKADLGTTPKTWYAEVDASNTTLWMNSAGVDPAGHLVEINVRKYVVSPSKVGLGYLTFDGFSVMHGATNWAPPDTFPQEGMLMTNWGLKWIVKNNRLSDGKAVCLASGLATSDGSDAIDKVGNHSILNNTIQRCGQAGIAGSHGLVASVIRGNLIEEINPTKHFGGYESGGIKIHSAIDVLIAGNVIRRVHSPGNGAVHTGIWIDWQSQGSRITGNLIYDIEQTILELEMNHGPTLIDNNIFVSNGHEVGDDSESSMFVHNLFVDTAWNYQSADARSAGYFRPHTTAVAGMQTHASADNRYFNNLYIGNGTGGVSQAPKFACDYNVIYKSSSKSSWADTHSIMQATFDPQFKVDSQATGATVTFNVDSSPRDVGCPLITRDFIGLSTVSQQGIENHDGSPITVDTDIRGAARDKTHPTAGPLESLVTAGSNTFTLTVGASVSGSQGSGGGRGGEGGRGAGGGTNMMGDSAGNGNGGANSAGGMQSGNSAGISSTVPASAGANSAGANSAGPGSLASPDSGGCSCELAQKSNQSSKHWLSVLGIGLGLHCARRRRCRGRNST